ncbi:MAG: hypothetical protein ACTSVI_06910 [Promethearchaeota archaeon]
MGKHIIPSIMLGWFLTNLIAFVLFIIPGVDFISSILNGLIQDLDAALPDLIGSATGNAGLAALASVLATLLELLLFNTFPISWLLTYRLDDALSLTLMIVPWLVAGLLTGLARTEKPLDGLKIGIVLIISNSIWLVLLVVVLPSVILNAIPMGAGGFVSGILNGLSTGVTDMPMGVSAILTQVEGGGLFIGTAWIASLLKEDQGELL